MDSTNSKDTSAWVRNWAAISRANVQQKSMFQVATTTEQLRFLPAGSTDAIQMPYQCLCMGCEEGLSQVITSIAIDCITTQFQIQVIF